MFRVAIFDLNGTIIEDEPLWRVAFNEVYREHGGIGDIKTKPGMGNQSNWEIIQENNPRLKQYSIDELADETADVYMERVTNSLKYRNGFEQYINYLLSKNIICVLATASSKYALESDLKVFPDLAANFSEIVNGDEVDKRKPAPDIFLKALEKLNSNLDTKYGVTDCVVFEDSNAGVTAANSANMFVVHLPNGLEKNDPSLSPNLVVQDFTDKRIYELFEGGE